MVVADSDALNILVPSSYSDPAIIVPKIGQLFNQETDAYTFYNLYAKFNGFGIRRSKSRFRKGGIVKTMQEFCCHRQGRDPKIKENPTRVGCKAMIRINRSSELNEWKITVFVIEHNHVLKCDLRHTKYYRSHNFIDDGTKSIVAEMVDKGVPPTCMYGLVAGMHGGPSLAPFTRRSLNRLSYAIRRDECSDDVQKTLDYLKELQSRSKEFYYTVRVDGACRINNIFWAHAFSRLSFDHFGDVVTFDTTYRTNRYNMPFGIFVGVNNHFQTIIFGCALLREETVESFKWLFQTFNQAMNGKKPAAILTDNCHQMDVAIKEVWPDSIHRVCKWHVLKKAKENLGNIYTKRNKFKEEFHNVLNVTQTTDEFENAWIGLLSKYELESSIYLRRMWDMREKWAPAYFKSYFFAKMSTTQRSESMNHVLKKYVKPSSSLNGFVRRYESFFFDRIQEEEAEEHQSYKEKVATTTSSPIEKHAARVYTRGAFAKFKEQFGWSFLYMVQTTDDLCKVKVTQIGDTTNQTWGKKVFEVDIKLKEKEIMCECKLFEHLGILCCHIIRVFIQNGYTEIPERYIMKRWTKDARDSSPKHLVGYNRNKAEVESRNYRHTLLHRSALEMVRLGDTNVQTYEKSMEVLGKLIDELKLLASSNEAREEVAGHSEKYREYEEEEFGFEDEDYEFASDQDFDKVEHGKNVTDDMVDDGLYEYEHMEILPPEVVMGRGRPKARRYMSNGESASQKKKVPIDSSSMAPKAMQIRYCGQCGERGHNKSTCGRPSTYKRK